MTLLLDYFLSIRGIEFLEANLIFAVGISDLLFPATSQMATNSKNKPPILGVLAFIYL